MSWEPRRICLTHGGRASFWYHGREWCWMGAELRVYNSQITCEVVWEVPTGKDET